MRPAVHDYDLDSCTRGADVVGIKYSWLDCLSEDMVQGPLLLIGMFLLVLGIPTTLYPQAVRSIGASRHYKDSEMTEYGVSVQRAGGVLMTGFGLAFSVMAF